MAFFNGWPWANFQEQNLDWIITTLKKTVAEVDEINANIEQYVDDLMQQWLDDGTLAQIIDQQIFSTKITRYDTFADIPSDTMDLGTIVITSGFYPAHAVHQGCYSF